LWKVFPLLGFSWCGMLSSRIMKGKRAEPGAGFLILPGALPTHPGKWKSESAGTSWTGELSLGGIF